MAAAETIGARIAVARRVACNCFCDRPGSAPRRHGLQTEDAVLLSIVAGQQDVIATGLQVELDDGVGCDVSGALPDELAIEPQTTEVIGDHGRVDALFTL